PGATGDAASAAGRPPATPPSSGVVAAPTSATSWWARLRATLAPANAAATLRTYGLSAVLAYGLFDAVTYSLSAVLAARAYFAAGGVWGWAAVPKIFAGMWLINNVSRPLRVAGALALAPVVERWLVRPLRAALSYRQGGGRKGGGEA
ncbi:hypothetical protein MMPV_005575, partial [Pyropia vietnamensis]